MLVRNLQVAPASVRKRSPRLPWSRHHLNHLILFAAILTPGLARHIVVCD